jgi:hypothetical protein
MPHQLRPTRELPGDNPHIHALAMFVVSEAQAAAIRAIFHQRGELSAAVELRRLFPGITNTEQAREYARGSPAGSRYRSGYAPRSCAH